MRCCKFCGKELIGRSKKHNIFCSNECFIAYKQKDKIDKWLSGEDNGHGETGLLSETIRQYLIKQAGFRCELCGWGEVNPTTGCVPLEIHHVDGNCFNSNISNLQVLCPNCHSLTPNFRSLNEKQAKPKTKKRRCIDCGKEISDKAIRCLECNSKHRETEKPISRDDLKALIRTYPFLQIGKMFGVSDNSIKKWCKRYNLPYKKQEIRAISDDDWLKI